MFNSNSQSACNNSALQSNSNLSSELSQNNDNSKSSISPPITLDLNVTLEETYNGWTKPATYERIGGASQQNCQICNRRGLLINTITLDPGMHQQNTGPCNDCNGIGLTNATKKNASLQVMISKGIKTGEKIVFEG